MLLHMCLCMSINAPGESLHVVVAHTGPPVYTTTHGTANSDLRAHQAILISPEWQFFLTSSLTVKFG